MPKHGKPGSVHVTGEGRFAGFVLAADGTDPDRMIIAGGKVANGLPADNPLTDHTMLVLTYTDAHNPNADTWRLPAGNCHLYLIADGRPVSVTLSLAGVSGSTRLTPKAPVAAELARPENRYLDLGAAGAGAAGRVRGPGLLLLAATLHQPTFQHLFTGCIYRGKDAAARATYAPGCPDATIRSRAAVTNVDPNRTDVEPELGSALHGAADTFGQGYSLIDAGKLDHVDYRALWLTF